MEFTNRTQAVIRWSTDVSTGSRVFYGESLSRMSQRVNGGLGVDHRVILPPLAPGTKWFFTVGTARLTLWTNSFVVPDRPGAEAGQIPAAASGPRPAPAQEPIPLQAPPSRETWGHLASLRDHFERHGADFKAANPDDYARMAWEFRQRAKREHLPVKVDSEGVIRIFDPKTGAFAAYNPNGTTRTFFKPGSRDYFDRQPGKLINEKGRDQ